MTPPSLSFMRMGRLRFPPNDIARTAQKS
jgi:hypothetical protein